MYSTWEKNKNINEITYVIQELLPSGQTMKLEISADAYTEKLFFNIYLTTSHKRKNIDDTYLKLTGKDGVYPLLLAKKRLIEIENIIRKDYKDKEIFLCIFWYDNRRRNVYYRGLKNIGYSFNRVYGKKCLIKKI